MIGKAVLCLIGHHHANHLVQSPAAMVYRKRVYIKQYLSSIILIIYIIVITKRPCGGCYQAFIYLMTG